MQITTKVDVYDTVYHMQNNKVVESIVREIVIVVTKDYPEILSYTTDIEYYVEHSHNPKTANEIFLTKQELLASL